MTDPLIVSLHLCQALRDAKIWGGALGALRRRDAEALFEHQKRLLNDQLHRDVKHIQR